MRVLVIDDNKSHLAAAQQTLVGHDLTLCASYDEAVNLLGAQYDDNLIEAKKTEYVAQGMKTWDAGQKARNESILPYWDAVLCDLLMPAGRDAQGSGDIYVGQEMPVGWSLALVAAKRGAKYVAVVTDIGHHDHPASAMLDRMNNHLFEVDGAKMLLTNNVGMVGITGSEGVCVECSGSGKKKRSDGSEYECYYCENGVAFSMKGKDWGNILNCLLETEKK